jgi:asparagine synthase (glutamine-hydrolysing)
VVQTQAAVDGECGLVAMPGIVGLITKMPRECAESQLRAMVASMHHSSHWGTGTWIDEFAGAYAGWTVRRNSFADGMPVRNERGDVVLIFSGEEFPDPATARRLQAQGHVLEGKGPSYLAHLYEEDRAFPAGLNGRFHGMLTNQSCGTTSLFNDRYGMHRLYYHEAKEAFYFAAEAKAILAVRPELRTADLQALGEFVACGCVLENRTLFTGVHVLPPAAAWTFRAGILEKKGTYFDPREWEDQEPSDPEQYYWELREVFSRNLPRYFKGPEPIAMSLTGGLDTRMIMAWQKVAPGALPCYSFGGSFRDSQDVRVARQVAKACGQPHEVIPVGDEFLARFPDYAERVVYLTDGCVAVNHAPDLYLNERAAEIAPVRMTGNYGGEVLRRVRAFKPVEPVSGLFTREFLSHVHEARETYAKVIQLNPLSFAVFRQAPWHHYGLLALEQTQVSLRSSYLDNELVRTVFRAPEGAFINHDVSLRLIADGNAALRCIRTDLGLGGAPGISAVAGRRWLEFTFKAEYAYDSGMPQWLAGIDHLLSPLHLERIFLGWHKFSHFRVWYRDVLSEYIRGILLDSRTLSRPYIERNMLEAIVRAHVKGDRNYTAAIHRVLTLELLHRLFLDSGPDRGQLFARGLLLAGRN